MGGSYFVSDGHRRVSVARSLRRKSIPAHVIEIRTRAPVPAGVDGGDLLRMAEYAAFLEETGLDRTRPEARLEVSRLGRYDELMTHILGHRYFLGLDQQRDVPLAEAAASWYDNVFVPIRDLLRRHDVLARLPGWTDSDAYVEATRRWLELSASRGAANPHVAVHGLLDARAGRWWKRTALLQHLRTQLRQARKSRR
jgi:FAD/FMN-containing dehydrogenase